MIYGTVLIDVRDIPPDRAYRRTTGLSEAPDGVRVVVIVGALAVDPHTVRLIAEHAARLEIEVQGEALAVRRWVEALREPGLLPGVA
jgi:hypothetical protein